MEISKKLTFIAGMICCTFISCHKSNEHSVIEKMSEPEVIKHSFFVAGPKFTGIISEDGHEIWNTGKPGARDGYVLPNGNILICWADEVLEYDQDKEVIFTYKRNAPDEELGTAMRLENKRTL